MLIALLGVVTVRALVQANVVLRWRSCGDGEVCRRMPLGMDLSLEGLLQEKGRQLYLRMDDGGGWRVDAGWSARKLLGRRVRIEGRRDEFDLMTAKRNVPANMP
jgi:hypothetical protein